MAFTYAGQYTEVILGSSSAGFAVALPALSVHVYTVGTTTHPTLYTSRTKGTTSANPATTDVNGNLTFFVDPGQYDIVFTPPGGSQKRVTVLVPQDPAEDSATYQSLPMSYAPSVMPLTPTLTDGGGPGISWLSGDGVTLFSGGTDALLRWSTNDGTSWTAHSFTFAQAVQRVRDTADGEILVSCWDGASAGVVYKSSGWTANHATATFSIKLTAAAAGNYFAQWGFSTVGAVVLWNEYGNKAGGGNQARYMKYSTDYGATWSTIFDLATTPISGTPVGNISGTHLHGACYDTLNQWGTPRIWVSYGDDQASGKVAYSDDLGATWKAALVANQDATHGQDVGIYSMPKAVVFLCDQPPNAIRSWPRGSDQTAQPLIHNGFYLDTADKIRWLGMTAYQRTSGVTNPELLMAFEPQGSAGPSSLVVGTVDGLTFYELWRDTVLVSSTGLFSFVGPTASGNYVGSIAGDGRSANYTLVKATAPKWAPTGLTSPTRSTAERLIPAKTVTNNLDLPFGQETFPYYVAAGSIGLATQRLAESTFTAIRTEQVGWIYSATSGTAAGATPTLCQMGIFLVDPATGALTLVASCANDTTLWASTTTLYKRALTSPYTLVEGQKYSLAALCVTAATAPTIAGCGPAAGNAGFTNSLLLSTANLRGSLVTGQASLANIAAVNRGSAGTIPWLAVTP